MKQSLIISLDTENLGSVGMQHESNDPDFVPPLPGTREEGLVWADNINMINTAITTFIRDAGEKGLDKIKARDIFKMYMINRFSGGNAPIERESLIIT